MNEYAKQIDYELLPSKCAEHVANFLCLLESGKLPASDGIQALASLCHFGYAGVSIEMLAVARMSQILAETEQPLFADHIGAQWYWIVTSGLWLVLMYGSVEQVETYCAKFRLDLSPGYTGRFDAGYVQSFLLIANAARPVPEDDSELVGQLRKSKKKQVALLLDAFLAATRGTQEAYDRALLAGMKDFRSRNRTYRDFEKKIFDLISVEYTCLHAMAERLGKKTPPLPVNLAASLVTKHSIANPPRLPPP
jgi:hypothetical protein